MSAKLTKFAGPCFVVRISGGRLGSVKGNPSHSFQPVRGPAEVVVAIPIYPLVGPLADRCDVREVPA